MKQVSGLINQRIEILKYEDQPDGSGGSIPVEVTYWSTSATVLQLKASRSLEANQERLKPVFKFEVRYRDDKFVIEDMVIKWRGETFRINQAEPDYVYRSKLVITAIANALPGYREQPPIAEWQDQNVWNDNNIWVD